MFYGIPTIIPVVQSDYGYALNFALTDSAGAIVDISGSAVTLSAQLQSNQAVQFTHPMTILSGPAGTCYYTVLAADFTVAGTYNVQISINYGAGTQIITFDGIQIVADDKIPLS